MKTLTILGSKMEAELTVGLLKANGIEAFINGSREYAALVTGTDFGRFEISVREDDELAARAVLESGNAPEEDTKDSNSAKSIPKSVALLKKKAVIFALMSILFFPLVMNVASLHYLRQYWQAEKEEPSRSLWTLFILVINLLGVCGGTYLLFVFVFR